MKIPKKIYVSILVAILIIFGFWTFYLQNSLEKIEVKEEFGIKKTEDFKPTPSSVSILVLEKNIKLEFIPGQTLYEILKRGQELGLISFSGKNYPSLGFLVNDIGNMKQENGKYLIYYINNKEASVGVSSYIPNDGDIIRWELK